MNASHDNDPSPMIMNIPCAGGKPMKIGLVIYGSLDILSGGYLYDRRLVEYLRAEGDAVEIISLPLRSYAAHLTDNLSIKIPAGFDLLIQDELNHPSLIAANRRRHPCPIVSLVHHLRCSELRPGWQNVFYRFVEKEYLSSVDGFIFNSQTTKTAVEALIGEAKPSIVANPPTDRFGAAISEEEIKTRASHGTLRILFLGNLIERKGLHILLKALCLTATDVRLDIVGSETVEPAYAGKMREFTASNGLSTTVTFHSPLGKEPLVEKLKQAHVLVVPSSYEGFGIVYLEGMGFGLPAIGTTAGAAGEIIEHGKTGFLIQPGDHGSLAAFISKLSMDRSLLVRLSLNARSRYYRQPAWSQTAGQIRAFLRSLVREK